MRFWHRVGLIVALCAVLALGVSARAIAETVTVTLGVGDSTLQVTGKTSPGAFVTISSDGNVIGTTVAGADGVFARTFSAQTPGIHELNIYAHTTGGEDTDTVTISVSITEHATTTVEVFLPSTVVIEDATLEFDQVLSLSGEAYPASIVHIFIDNTDFATATADALGNWAADINTSLLASGQHEFFVRLTDPIGNQSYPTALRTFSRAAAPPGTPTPTPPGTDTPPSTPAPGSGVPAITPPAVPRITFPSSDTVWEKPDITIIGKGQPNVQIELWDGTSPLGSVWSDDNGDWSIHLMLEPKEYRLRARACLGGVCSRFSSTIIVTYRPGGPLSPLQQPLIISMPQLSFTVIEGEALIIRPTILNGQPPYKVTVEWGDDLFSTGTHAKDQLTITHAYSTPGRYTATIYAEDAQGRKGSVQFTVEVLPSQAFSWLPMILIILCLLLVLLVILRLAQRKKRAAKEQK